MHLLLCLQETNSPTTSLMSFSIGFATFGSMLGGSGSKASANEQTCSMQWQSIYKTQCNKFNRICDGIQIVTVADDW